MQLKNITVTVTVQLQIIIEVVYFNIMGQKIKILNSFKYNHQYL
jgi:hypothetical protein